MLGNVWPWTADWYEADYYTRGDNRDPLGPPGGTQRVLRGGVWVNFPRVARASDRYWSGPVNRGLVDETRRFRKLHQGVLGAVARRGHPRKRIPSESRPETVPILMTLIVPAPAAILALSLTS